MHRKTFLEKYISPFLGLDYIFDDRGFIVWRTGTGENVEILHLRVYETRQGHATSLVRDMVLRLVDKPPYHSVFVFMRSVNESARLAYESMGFILTDVGDLYASGGTTIGIASYEELVKKYGG